MKATYGNIFKNITLFFAVILAGGFLPAAPIRADGSALSAPPMLVIQETVINHGKNKQVSDFPVFIANNSFSDIIPANSGVMQPVLPGNYIILAIGDSNYATTFQGDCAPRGAMAFKEGDSPKLCIITHEEVNLTYASDLSTADAKCPGIAGSSMAYFSWTYNNSNQNSESQFQFQVAKAGDPGFLSPVIDRTFSQLSYAPKTKNQQSVLVSQKPEAGSLAYGVPYIWRARVFDSNGTTSGWTGALEYKKTGRPEPNPVFTIPTQAVYYQKPVVFTNTSSCYNAVGPVPCARYLWDFGDGTTSTLQNPTHTFAKTGQYQVVLRAYDSVSSCAAQSGVAVGIPPSFTTQK